MSARTHAAFYFDIWDDEAFCDLSGPAQLLLHFLFEQPNLSYAGVLPLTMGRWARKLRSLGAERIRTALAELGATGFVLLDEDTEEVLIRGFVRSDRLWRMPHMLTCSIREARLIHSPTLRQAYGADLIRITEDPATAAEASHKFSPAHHAAAYALAGIPAPASPSTPGPTPGEPLANPSGNPSAGDSPTPPTTPAPTPTGTPREGPGVGAGAGAPAPQSPPSPLRRENSAPKADPPPKSCTRHARWRRSCLACVKANAAPPPCAEHGTGPRHRLNAEGQPVRCPDCSPEPRHVPYHLTVVAGGG